MAGTAVTTLTQHRRQGTKRIDVAITTDASGDMSATVVGDAWGRIVGYRYDGGLDASATITVKDFKTGASIFVLTTGTEGTAAGARPTGIIATKVGGAVSAADTAPNVNRDIYVAGKLTVTVASGGNAETGAFALIIDENGLAPQAYR